MNGKVSAKSSKFPTSMPNQHNAVLLPVGEEDNIVEYLTSISSESDYFRKLKVFEDSLLSTNTQESTLISWLKQFRDSIFFLGQNNEKLTVTILHMDWVHKSPAFISMYQELILNLVSAHALYLSPVLKMLIKLFSTGEDGSTYVTEKEKENFHNGHQLLKRIISLIPLSPNALCTSLFKNFPYMRKELHIHVCYVINILEICTYLPSHRQIILNNLVNKLLVLDTHCSREEIELAEESASDETVFAMEQDGPDGNKKEKADSYSMALPLASILDLLLDCVMNFVNNTCKGKDGAELNWEATKMLFKEILSIFDAHILTTPGCTHVQFILLHLCSLKPELHELFLDYLWKKIQNPNTAPTKRRVATFYIASFLARALYVNISTVCACLDLMCNWVHSYIDNHSCPTWIDISAHETFYVVCQAIFYVFAFRHAELVAMRNGLKYLQRLNFEHIISCKLNPLSVCIPGVVENFAKLTKEYQLAYCNTVIERNNRTLISRVMRSRDDESVSLDVTILQTFFPFDPYLLKRSKKWIESLYRVYGASTDEEDMDDHDETIEETSLLLLR